jgi:hypothetical protein
MLSPPATGITRMLVTRGEEPLWLDTIEVFQIYPGKTCPMSPGLTSVAKFSQVQLSLAGLNS